MTNKFNSKKLIIGSLSIIGILMVVFSVLYINAFAAEETTTEEANTEVIVSEDTPLSIETEEQITESSDLTPPKHSPTTPEGKIKTDSNADLLHKFQNSPLFHKIQDKTIALGQNVLDQMKQKILNPSKPSKTNIVEAKKEPLHKTSIAHKGNKLSQSIDKNKNLFLKIGQ
ncbi:MAG: hypothetical protein U9532_00125 ['Conium maculatum' witches'-broom phytoplasma]|nr:hypothetical protein ['Conium maculatum' witches'-broom phytoplasma]